MSETELSREFTISNPELDESAVVRKPTPEGFLCSECRERGFIPTVYQPDCPMCFGDDPYGQPTYCAECEFCCGC